MSESAQILVRHAVDLKAFREEIMPAVRAGRESARARGDYLCAFDGGKPVAAIEGPPSIHGHLFYRPDQHQVESLTPFHVLVNYWWNEARQTGSPFDSLLHAMLTLRDLPAEQRAVWREMFEHYVFTAPDEALSHLAREQRGMLGPPSAERTQAIRAILRRAFSGP